MTRISCIWVWPFSPVTTRSLWNTFAPMRSNRSSCVGGVLVTSGLMAAAFQTSFLGSSIVDQTTIFRNATGDPKDIVVFTSAETNKVRADIDVVGFTTGTSSTTSSSGPFETLQADFGDLDSAFGDGSATSGESVFVDNFAFAADDRGSPAATFVSSLDPVANAELTMIAVETADEFSNGFLPSGVTVCSCTFLTWGFWNADIDRSSTSHSELIHLANWVAGTVPTAAEILALTGTASYSGHAIGTVFNAGGVYQAIGNFTSTVRFRRRDHHWRNQQLRWRQLRP